MKISNNWLKDYITTDVKVEKIGEFLTDIGLEVEGIESFENIKGGLKGIVVGKVLTVEKHPNADKLNKTTVDAGDFGVLDIVCGAPNVAQGQTVAVATVGTKIFMPDGTSFEIKEAKIRGEKSEGMLCSEKELGIGEDTSGILVLDEEKYVVGTPLSEYYDLVEDHVYEIGLTPNRTDAMSHFGVARDLHAFLTSNNIGSSLEKLSMQPISGVDSHNISIEVEDANLCPKYHGAILRGVTVEPSPEWLQNRLLAIGLAPINNVVDITNYILHSTGQPLHAFDLAKIKGNKVKVGVLPEGSVFTTLDGVERKLSGNEVMIKDGEDNPLCIAGVFGGKESGVSSETTDIFLESAYFNPVAVRKAAKTHQLSTDASFRFERGIDPKETKVALSYAIKLLEEIAGAELVGEVLDFQPSKIEGKYVVLRYSMLDQILGVKIHREKVKEILRALDIEILNEITNGLELIIPTFKADVTREIDVIEEVLRIYGYNKVENPGKLSFTPVSLSYRDQQELEDSWASLLVSQGFNEVMNNSLTHEKDASDAVTLLNPLSGELSHMRKSLLEGLLKNAEYNIHRKNADIKFFELGKIYHKINGYKEHKQVALLVSGRDQGENWLMPKSRTSFYNLKSYVMILLKKTGLTFREEPLEDERFSDAISILSDNKVVARIGKVNEKYLKEYDVDQECYYSEIEIEEVQNQRSQKEIVFKDIPKFNTLRRDLALLVDNGVSYQNLIDVVWKNPSKYLKSVNLFDVYQGDKLPEGKKSYALSFELLSEERTLEDKDITEVMNTLIKRFEKEFSAELR